MCDPANIRLVGMVASVVAVLVIIGVMLFSERWSQWQQTTKATPFGVGTLFAMPVVAIVVVVSVGMEVFCGS